MAVAGTIYKWEFKKAHRSMEVGVEGPLISGDEGIVIDAAMVGVSLAYLIEDQVTAILKAGALSRVLEDWCPPRMGRAIRVRYVCTDNPLGRLGLRF